MSSRVDADRSAAPPSRVSGLLLGLGLGGFVDGIVLHQVLQWHHMVSDVAEYPPAPWQPGDPPPAVP